MGLKINGSTSGSIEIDVPAVAGTDTSITIPAKDGGTFIVEESTGNIDLGPLDINGSASDDSVNIDASGRLLVGTTSASGDFGAVVNAGGTARVILARTSLPSSAGGLGNLGWGRTNGEVGATIGGVADTNWTSGSEYPTRLVFSTTTASATSPTERMRLDRFGYLRTNSDSVGMSVHVVGTSNNIFEGYNGASNGSYNGTNKIYIENDGDVKNVNNSYGAASDIKLKENIVDAASQWNDLKAIQVRKYNFKEETGHRTHTQLGVIAQEIELVSPGLVSESPDRDADGNDLGTTTKSVNYSVLYMKSVKALQEAMERIETLETANASLEARLTALEGGAS